METKLNKNYFLNLNNEYSISPFFLNLITKVSSWLYKPSINRKITVILIILSIVAPIITFLVFSNSLPYVETTPRIVTITLSIDVILLFGLCYKVIRKIVKTWIDRRKGIVGSKIATKFIFNVIAILVLFFAC